LFFGAHRADADCLAVLELLATSLDGQHPLMHVLLRSAEKPTYKIWADGAPFDRKDALKARHYHWNDGTDGKPKAWCIELADADKANELQWLMTNVYGGKHIKLTEERYTARNRYSALMA
jgi:DNA polymerase-3 subunit epsilon